MSKVTKPRTTFERSANLFMALVCVICLLAIAGWLTGQPILASFRPEFIPMAPSTALMFLGVCGAWLIHSVYSARRGMRILVQAGLVGMWIIVLIIALKYFTGLGPDLEQMLYPNPTLFDQISTARMSPLTDLGFFLAISALLLMTGREPGQPIKSASAALSLAVLILSGLNIMGYIYGAPLFYGGTFIPVAFTTALSLLSLSLGLLMAAGPTCWPARMYVGRSLKARLMRAFIPTSLGVVLLQGLLSTASEPWIANPAIRVAVAALVACLVFMLIIYLIAQNLSTEIDLSNQARVTAESTLNQSEVRFRSIAETASDAIINIDRGGQVVFWNRAAETIFGYSAGEVMGKPLDIIMPEEFRPAHRQGLRRVILTGETHIIGRTVEVTGLRKDGSVFPMALSLATWQVGEDDFFTGIARDISERKHAEEALRESKLIIEGIINAIPARVFWKDKDLVYLGCNALFARDAGFTDPKDVIGKDDYQMVWRDQAELYRDADRLVLESGAARLHVEEPQTTPDGNTITLLSSKVPLRSSRGEIIGVLGTYIDITDRKQAEQALRESEERFRSLYEKVPTGIYRTSPDGHILMANPALVRMLGYETFEELSQRNLATESYESKNLRQEFQKRIERDGEVRGFESAWKCKDGTILYMRESAHLVQNEDNQPFYYEGTVEDISERMRVEEELRKSTSSLQAVLQSTADGILAIGIKNEVLYANERFAKIWRIPQAVMASQNDSTLLRHVLDQLSDPQSFIQKVQELYQSTEESFDTLNFKDGRVFERLSRPLMQGQVVLGRVWSFRDITERRQADEALRQSENRFHTLFDQAAVGVALIETKTGRYKDINQSYCDFLGYTKEEMLNLSFQDISYPDKIQENIENNAKLITGKIREFSLEKRYIRKDGRIVWGELTASPLWMPGEDVSEYMHIAVVQDITERKRAEEEILSLSLTDELTGLYNRRGFTVLAEQELKLAHRMKRAMQLFFGDVDNLKTINDTWGHTQGDLALKDIAAILQDNFRESDILARIGGDEFVVLAVDASVESTETIANRIHNALEARNQRSDVLYQLTLSMGYAYYDPEAPNTVSELIAQADGMMYQQKQAKKG